jgi:hypothetical protein
VRQPGVERGDLAGSHRDVVLAEDQPHLAGEHVQPLVAGVGAEPALPLGGMTTFHTAGEGSAVAIAINTDLVRDDVGIAVDDLRALTDGKEDYSLSPLPIYTRQGGLRQAPGHAA